MKRKGIVSILGLVLISASLTGCAFSDAVKHNDIMGNFTKDTLDYRNHKETMKSLKDSYKNSVKPTDVLPPLPNMK